MTLFVF